MTRSRLMRVRQVGNRYVAGIGRRSLGKTQRTGSNGALAKIWSLVIINNSISQVATSAPVQPTHDERSTVV